MNSSPRTAQSKLEKRKPDPLYSKIGTTKDLIDRTNMQSIFKYKSLFKKQTEHKKAPSSAKNKKTAKQLTINTKLSPKVKSTTPKPLQPMNKTKTPCATNKAQNLTRQPLSCKNKGLQGDPFFVSNRAKKAETPCLKIQTNSPQANLAKRMNNYFTTKNKENAEKENMNKLEFFKSALADKQIKAKRALEAAEALDTEVLRTFDVDILIAQYTKILALYCYSNNQEDCYIIIKQYTEAVQHDCFLSIDQLFNSTANGLDLLLAVKYELLCVLTLFFFLIEKGTSADFNDILEVLASSGYCILSLLKQALEFVSQKKQAKKIDDFLKESQTSNLFTKHKNLFNTLRRNNAFIKTSLEKLLRQVPSPSCKNILLKLPLLSFSEATHISFESFFSILNSKGVISVVEEEAGETHEEDTPNFIIQPLECKYYLPPKTSKHEYTLVLDLDETLVHYDEVGGQFFLRPFAQEFIAKTAEMFEVVIFTAAVKEYADWILDRLDNGNHISHRLYRCSTSQQNDVYIKDLQKIGRDLTKTLIVDNSPENFQLQPENGIYIKSWYDDPTDKALEELAKVLKYISGQKGRDIRGSLKELRTKSLK